MSAVPAPRKHVFTIACCQFMRSLKGAYVLHAADLGCPSVSPTSF